MRAAARSLRFLGEGKKLQVPFFQRSYVWEESNWEELLQTFLNFNSKPFLGSLIIKHSHESEDYIIDGQQRLTTITILAKAIYDSLPGDKEQSGIRREIESFLFYKNNSADDFCDSHVKIEHSRLDREAYEFVIKAGLINEDEEIDISKIEKGSSKILQCYKYFKEKLENYSTEMLKQLFNSLFNEDRLVIILIQLDYSDINEQSIFDTINRAGVHLIFSDIIKNNLFKRLIDLCPNEDDKNKVIDVYKKNWDNIFNCNSDVLSLWDEKRVFGNVQHTNLEFLLYCVACIKWGEDRDMFQHLADDYETHTSHMEQYELYALIEDIKKYAQLFKQYVLDLKCSIDNADNDVYFKYDNYITRLLFILQKFKVQMFYPYVLKRLFESDANSDDETLKRDFWVLESFIMRRKISSRGTQDYTHKCYQIINEGVEKLFDNNEADITDIEVSRALSNTKDDAASMILFWIELYQRKKKDYDSLALEYVFTLEHIMPRTWEKYWSDIKIIDGDVELGVNSDDGKLYRNIHIQSIGNKTLLTSKLNSTVKNSCFRVKIKGNGKHPGYENHTSLLITKTIVDNFKNDQTWDETHIDRRKDRLFDLFKEVWPFFKNSNENRSNDEIEEHVPDVTEATVDDFEAEAFEDANSLLDALSFYQVHQDRGEEENNTDLKQVFVDEVKYGRMNFSYKPIFIKALFTKSDESGKAFLGDIASYFMCFFNDRKVRGLPIENPLSIFCKDDYTVDDVMQSILKYPLKIYQETKTVIYNPNDYSVSFAKKVWLELNEMEKEELIHACDKRIENYYKCTNW